MKPKYHSSERRRICLARPFGHHAATRMTIMRRDDARAMSRCSSGRRPRHTIEGEMAEWPPLSARFHGRAAIAACRRGEAVFIEGIVAIFSAAHDVAAEACDARRKMPASMKMRHQALIGLNSRRLIYRPCCIKPRRPPASCRADRRGAPA